LPHFKPAPRLTRREETIQRLKYIRKAVDALLLAVEESHEEVPRWAEVKIGQAAVFLGTAVSAVRASRRKA